ncbi:chemotaxis protein CheX [Acidiferrimicrobium sp. IK]|uniref:chemotaxis protein CheX n=1 Tax=Acidiferrimicrobium sp. IK TaxID=2871700 RepID=UPI0021CB8B46|nr:chemotaxis protein CheX [Acidiferrimicrobium sp. IK]MCU4185661.1 chemotaxis protein CheX [Acidiferrimicrobium sp. IK]
MTTPTLTGDMIAELTQDIWSALLNDEGGLRTGGIGGNDVAATVEISGEWNGTACLSCSEPASRHAAAAMFGMEVDELSGSDVRDAVGELVNVVGGNIKALLPGPTELSLPSVHDEGDYTPPGHLELTCEVKFTWMDEPVVITLWNAG